MIYSSDFSRLEQNEEFTPRASDPISNACRERERESDRQRAEDRKECALIEMTPPT